MYRLQIILFLAIQNLDCSVGEISTSGRGSLSELSSGSIQRRWDLQRSSEQFNGQWVALGDSFSAGPGAGSSLDSDCSRFDGGYPRQLQSEALWPGSSEAEHPLQFLSCNGATMVNVTKKQVPQMLELGDSGIITLSVGANDVLFSKILLNCLANLGEGTCDQALAAGREKLYGLSLWEEYQQLVLGLTESTDWLGNALSDRKPLIYQTAYPALFDANTTQCNGVTFNPLPGSSNPKLSQELRRKLNLFSAEVNIMIAFWITHMNQQLEDLVSPNNTSPIYFVDQDAEYTDHRFCREGITEPDTEKIDTWFTHTKNTDLGTKESDFAGVEAQTCLTTAGDRMDLLYKCYVAKEAAQNPNFNYSIIIQPDKQASIFHPTVAGMGGVAKAVSRAMRLPAVGTKPLLRILAAGDSITRGSGSPATGGYRNYLNDLMVQEVGEVKWIGSQVEGTIPDLGVVQKPHEGYGGITVPGLHEKLTANNSALDRKPNLVLLMIGTNDIHRDASVAETTRLLEELLNLIWLRSGNDTLIIISTIIPIGPSDANSTIYPMANPQRRVMQYNGQIKNLVNEMRALGRNINIMHTPVSQYDRYDLLHPTPRGYEKIAHSWFEAILRAAQNGQIPDRQDSKNGGSNKDDAENGTTGKKSSSGTSILFSWMSIGLLVLCFCCSTYML